jgi:hypothetical protein
VALGSANCIVSSLQDLARFGFDSAFLAHDIPEPTPDDYYIAIMRNSSGSTSVSTSTSSVTHSRALDFSRAFGAYPVTALRSLSACIRL